MVLQELLESIVPDMTADEHFYKLVYSFYIDNPALLPVICEKLMAAGRKDIVQAYNTWCAAYQTKRDEMLRPIAKMLREQINKEYDQLCQAYRGGEKKKNATMRRRNESLFMGLPQDW